MVDMVPWVNYLVCKHVDHNSDPKPNTGYGKGWKELNLDDL